MLNKRNSIQHDVWRLIFIPTFSVIILISVTLGTLCVTQLGEHVQIRGKVFAEQTARLIYTPLINKDYAQIQEYLKIGTEEPFVRSVQVYNVEDKELLQQGPNFILSDEDLHNRHEIHKEKLEHPTHYRSFHTLRFSHPVKHKVTNETLGWVEVEILSTPYQLIRSNAIVLSFIITLLCLIVATYLAFSLYFKIVRPLTSIKRGVSNIAKGQLSIRIRDQKTSEFQDVADSINEMADAMETAQQDMQMHIDLAVRELHETLETIEIQNVQLDIARKEALEASRVKSEFLANTSHEIRTPLNGILGFVNLLAKSDINQKQRDYIDTIRDSAQNLLTVINGILDFSKIEAGKLTLDYTPLGIQSCIDEVFHLLAPVAEEKHIQLINYIDPNIPENLLGDSLRLKQIFTNLVNNAIKYSPSGNIIVNLQCLSKDDSQITIKVSITDEGIGLSKTEQDSLFEPFIQVDSSNNRQYDGTGLGLAICKGLVERMQGEIGVESAPNQGATFWFTARLGIDKNQPDFNLSPNLTNLRVLICGEEVPSRKQLGLMTTSHNAEVSFIETVHDCFIRLREGVSENRPFSILILDLAPDERKIPPSLLSSLSEQINNEFGCHSFVCCNQTQQRIYSSSNNYPHLTFILKPLNQAQLFTAIARKLHLQTEIKASETFTSLSHAKVLLVDDNPANLQLAAELLKDLHVHIVTAGSGPEAIEYFKKETFDIIYMDIQMPGMDGIETTKIIRQLENGYNRVPIVALTAHSITDHKKELLIAGMDDCLSKPISELQLSHSLQRWVNFSETKPISPTNSLQFPASILPYSPIAPYASISPYSSMSSSGPLSSYASEASYSTISPPTQPVKKQVESTRKNKHEENLSVVDLSRSLKLANNKHALAIDMLTMLIESLQQDISRINQYADDQNEADFAREIHKLYGSSCYCGVPKLKYVSGLIDKLCHVENFSQAYTSLPALNHAIEEILEWSKNKDIAALINALK